MNYSKILAFLIALFQAPVAFGMESGETIESGDEAVVLLKGKRQIESAGDKALVGPVIVLDFVEDEGTLVVRTPSSGEKKRKGLRIGEGSFAEVYTTREMVDRGSLKIVIPSIVMDSSEFSVLREIVSRGLLKVEIPPVREPYVEPAALQIMLKEGYLRAADMYYKGLRIPENKGAAFFYFKSAARKGSSRGLFHAALMLDMGEGVPMDKVEAANLYSLAIRRGHPVAPYNLGLMLINNEVCESYQGETIQYAIFLAQRGLPQAQEILWRMGIPW